MAKRRGPIVLGRALAVLSLSLVSIASDPLGGTGPAAAVPPPGTLMSRYESAGRDLRRDCGFSAPLPADTSQSVWLFCDIQEYAGSTLVQFRPGTFASVGPSVPGQVPEPLSELPSPPQPIGSLPSNRAPEPLLPLPTDLSCGGGSNYATIRPTGVAQGPGGDLKLLSGSTPVTIGNSQQVLLITYVEACVDGINGAVHAKRFGIVAWHPATNLIRARFTVFTAPSGGDLPWYQNLGSPIFDPVQKIAYFFASTCDNLGGLGCNGGRVFLSRVRLSAAGSTLHNPANYQYWAASLAGWDKVAKVQRGWTDASHAESILPAVGGGGPMLMAQVNDFRWVPRGGNPSYPGRAEGLVLVELTNVGGGYRVWQADTPTGRWALKSSASTNCVLCGPVVAHPTLSSPTQLLATHFRQSQREVEVVSIGDLDVTSGPSGLAVTSNQERSRMEDQSRECGFSAPLPRENPTDPPTESLWVFCDMSPRLNSSREDIGSLYFGTWMGIGPITPGRVPTGISDGNNPPRPNDDGPTSIIGAAGTLPGPQGQPCGADLDGNREGDSVPLRWANGITRAPAGPMSISQSQQVNGSRLLVIPFMDVCYTGFGVVAEGGIADIHVKRTGVAIYDGVSQALLATHIVFDGASPSNPVPAAPFDPGDLDWRFIVGHPVFHGGQLYLVSGICQPYIDPYLDDYTKKCPQGKTMAVRVSKNQTFVPGQYQWFIGATSGSDQWGADPMQATSIVPATSPTRGPIGFSGVYLGDYTALGKGFLLFEPTSWVGHYRIWQAAAPNGPWTLVRPEGSSVIAGCEPDPSGQPRTPAACHNIAGHPELSTADHLLMSHIQVNVRPGDQTADPEAEMVDIGTVPNL